MRETSLTYRALTAILHRLDVPGRMLADMTAERTRVKGPPMGLQGIDRFDHDGQTVYRFAPRRGAPVGRVLHLHGGAFAYGLLGIHYRFAARLARLSGAEVWLPEYPLPPRVTAADITAWTDGLAARAAADGHFVLMGDSAGGGLAVEAATRRVVKRGAVSADSLPTRLLLLSPWTDLTGEGPVHENADEPLIAANSGAVAARRYAGSLDLRDPIVSPSFGRLEGLPETVIFAGERDILWPDIQRFFGALEAAGVPARLVAEPDLGHYWMYYPVPEARRTMAEIAAIVRSGLLPGRAA